MFVWKSLPILSTIIHVTLSNCQSSRCSFSFDYWYTFCCILSPSLRFVVVSSHSDHNIASSSVGTTHLSLITPLSLVDITISALEVIVWVVLKLNIGRLATFSLDYSQRLLSILSLCFWIFGSLLLWEAQLEMCRFEIKHSLLVDLFVVCGFVSELCLTGKIISTMTVS